MNKLILFLGYCAAASLIVRGSYLLTNRPYIDPSDAGFIYIILGVGVLWYNVEKYFK